MSSANNGTPTPKIVGELTEEEQNRVRGYQSRADQLMYQMGAQVVKILDLYGQYNQNNADAVDHGRSVLSRLGIPETATVRIHENKVLVYDVDAASGESPPSEE